MDEVLAEGHEGGLRVGLLATDGPEELEQKVQGLVGRARLEPQRDVGDGRAPVRGGHRGEGRDAIVVAEGADQIARVETALAVGDEVDLAGALVEEHGVDQRRELIAAHDVGVEGIEHRDRVGVPETAQLVGYAVEVVDRADVLEAHPPVHQHHGEARGLLRAARCAADREVVGRGRVELGALDHQRELARARGDEGDLDLATTSTAVSGASQSRVSG